ncbi:transmembrane and death domain protein 1 [Pezoporus flaviventris]|uniref:transmembrane and death domain protein 1 n=1 Tax=Pezoporus flaviventris TaxID=889875 RepID=UPI002AB0E6D9|nr:transmembrane and death domain protein 1 [Pezoporus flaviventris]
MRREVLRPRATLTPRSTRSMLVPAGLILLLLAAGSRCEDTVAANVGSHTMARIADLLAQSECLRLRLLLSGPDALGERELQRLSEESNRIPRRHRRDLRGPVGCSETLRGWLRRAGEALSWDRLARGLRSIGRPDIARELGKNLNQDRSLELLRNVRGYGRAVKRPRSPLLLRGERRRRERDRRAPSADFGDLVVERRPPPPYTRSLLGWVVPVASGILGGFLAAVVLAAAAASSCCWVLSLDAA